MVKMEWKLRDFLLLDESSKQYNWNYKLKKLRMKRNPFTNWSALLFLVWIGNPHNLSSRLALSFCFSLKIFLVVGSTMIRRLCFVHLALPCSKILQQPTPGWLNTLANFVVTSEWCKRSKIRLNKLERKPQMALKSYGKSNSPAG